MHLEFSVHSDQDLLLEKNNNTISVTAGWKISSESTNARTCWVCSMEKTHARTLANANVMSLNTITVGQKFDPSHPPHSTQTIFQATVLTQEIVTEVRALERITETADKL